MYQVFIATTLNQKMPLNKSLATGLISLPYHRPHKLVHLLQRFGGLFGSMEFQSLAGSQQLNGHYLLHMLYHCESLPCCKPSHGDMVLCPG